MTEKCWIVIDTFNDNNIISIFNTEEKAKKYVLKENLTNHLMDKLYGFKDVYENTMGKSYEPLDNILNRINQKLYQINNDELCDLELSYLEEIFSDAKALNPWLKEFEESCGGEAFGEWLKGKGGAKHRRVVCEFSISEFENYEIQSRFIE